MPNPFQDVGRTQRLVRSAHDLSAYRLFDYDIGKLVPVFCRLCLPNEDWHITSECFMRANPMVAPLMHPVKGRVDYFKVPLRLLWPKPVYEVENDDGSVTPITTDPDDSSWVDFSTQGPRGPRAGKTPPVQPKWSPSDTDTGSLWDYFGHPVGVVPVGRLPNAWQLRAYNLCINEFFRDETLDIPRDLDDDSLFNRRWPKDYFTSATEDPQRGDPPAISLEGLGSASWSPVPLVKNLVGASGTTSYAALTSQSAGSSIGLGFSTIQQDGTGFVNSGFDGGLASNLTALLNNNTITSDVLGAIDVEQIRWAFAVQRHLEKNSRGGIRYIEWLRLHWDDSPRDETLQRPAYLGGTKFDVSVSEVLQTSSSDATSPQGNLAGHGIAFDRQSVVHSHTNEFCVIIGLFSCLPATMYQQGVDREWLYDGIFEYPLPEFVSIGDQAIEQVELFASADATENSTIFGYTGRFNELRFGRSMALGHLRSQSSDSLDFWHLARSFDSAPALNSEFVDSFDVRKDYLAVPSKPGWIVSFGNRVKAVRSIPAIGIPGLIDHN